MKIKVLDSTGSELEIVSLNGNLKAFTKPNRVPYTGAVTFESYCENGTDHCTGVGGGDCNTKTTLPHFKQFPGDVLQGYKVNGEYDHVAIKEAFNFGDTLPSGTCSNEKLFIFFIDAVAACSWHLEDGWVITAIFDVPFCQPY